MLEWFDIILANVEHFKLTMSHDFNKLQMRLLKLHKSPISNITCRQTYVITLKPYHSAMFQTKKILASEMSVMLKFVSFMFGLVAYRMQVAFHPCPRWGSQGSCAPYGDQWWTDEIWWFSLHNRQGICCARVASLQEALTPVISGLESVSQECYISHHWQVWGLSVAQGMEEPEVCCFSSQ